jgi:hypothetical protein
MTSNQVVTATFSRQVGKPAPECTIMPKSNKVVLAPAAKQRGRSKHANKPGTLSVSVTCNQAANVTLSGVLTEYLGKRRGRHGQRTHTFQLRTAQASVVAGMPLLLNLKVPKSTLTALKNGKHESVTFSVLARNSNGASSTHARLANLKVVPQASPS